MGSGNNVEYLHCKTVAQTPKAYMISTEDYGDQWVPKSQVKVHSAEGDEDIVMTIPSWLVERFE